MIDWRGRESGRRYFFGGGFRGRISLDGSDAAPRVDLFTHEKDRVLRLPVAQVGGEGEHVLVERFERSFLRNWMEEKGSARVSKKENENEQKTAWK